MRRMFGFLIGIFVGVVALAIMVTGYLFNAVL